MAIAAIPAAAGIVGGIVGQIASSGDQQQAAADMAAAQAAYGNVTVPTIGEQQWNLANESVAGTLQPGAEATYSMGPNAMAGIQTNPMYAQAQMAALQSLAQQGQGGLTAQERANLINSNQAIAGQTNAQNAAIQQSMAARGMGGSGTQLAAQLANSQGSANQASTNANAINAQAQNTALQALTQGGQMATQQQGQAFGQQAAIAQAQNAINQFNTANTQNVAGYNTQAQNQAQAANLANQQNVANTNVGLQNQQQAHNTGLYQTQFGNQMQQAAGIAGTDQAAAGYQSNQAQQIAGMWAGIGSGAGTGAAAMMGSGSTPDTGWQASGGNESGAQQAAINGSADANGNVNLAAPGGGYAYGGVIPRYNHGGEVSTLGMNSFAEGGYVGGSDANSLRVSHPYRGMADGGEVDDAKTKAQASQDAFMKSIAQAAADNQRRAAQQSTTIDPAMQFAPRSGVASPLPTQQTFAHGGRVGYSGGGISGNDDGGLVAPNTLGAATGYPGASLTAPGSNAAIPNQAALAQGTTAMIPPTDNPYMYMGAPTNRQSNAAAMMAALTKSPIQKPSGGVQVNTYPLGDPSDAVDRAIDQKALVQMPSQDEANARTMTELAKYKAAKKHTMSDDDAQGYAFGGPVAARPLRAPQPMMNPRVPLVPNPQGMPAASAQGQPAPFTLTPTQKAAIISKMHGMAPKMSNGGEAQYDFKAGGHVPGTAQVKGDSPKNDTVKAKLSPGEIVLPRTVVHSKDPDAIMNFVRDTLAKKK
jgi:hypothetical protein